MLQRIGASSFVLVSESQNTKTGLGIRFGTWLLERGLSPKYARIGTHADGCCGTWEHAYHQGYDPKSIMERVRSLNACVAMAACRSAVRQTRSGTRIPIESCDKMGVARR